MKPATLLLFAVNSLGLASAASIGSPDDGMLDILDKRKCFKSGANFGNDENDALKAARKACSGPLKGRYQKRETRVRCYNVASNKHVKLTVGLTGSNAPSSRNLGFDECYNGLIKEIINCGKGGDKTYGRWRFRADPNEGKC